jgi:hypothetical protein
MRKFITFSRYLFGISSKSQHSSIALLLLTLALTTSWNRATAAPPQTAPPQLQNMLTQIDTAAKPAQC